jgi:hypothetical protein
MSNVPLAEVPGMRSNSSNGLRLVRVDWEGPLTLAEVLQRNGCNDFGVYMIEGHYWLYGCKGPLYFGKTTDVGFAETFRNRHRWWIEKWEEDVTIRLGRLRSDDDQEEPVWADWAKLVADVEQLTIIWHSFPYNKQYVYDEYTGQPLRVQNLGKCGRLQGELASDWPELSKPIPDLEEEGP